MISLNNVTRRFGDRVAVAGISFDIPAGELVGFVGANGAGKTTTMRMIMGVLAVSSGDICFGGAPVTSEQRRQFGYMPEERGLYPKQKIAEQLAFLGELAGLGRKRARARAMELLDQLGLGGRATDALESLSLGNQQRVQVAASLMNNPIALILDEPFSGLDPAAVDAMSMMLRAQAADGVPVLFSSHQLDLVERLCDRMIILHEGRVAAAGTATDLRRREQTHHRIRVSGDAEWLRALPQIRVIDMDHGEAVVSLGGWSTDDLVLEAMRHGRLLELVELQPTLTDVYREATSCAAA